MVSHPNRSRRFADRLNILIGRVVDDARTPGGRFTGLLVWVRCGYTGVEECGPDLVAGRSTSIAVPCRTAWDPGAVNNRGQRGASVVQVDRAAVERAVAELRDSWGDIPVQDNSGRFPELATAPGVLSI